MGVSDVATLSFDEQERALREDWGAHVRQLDLVTVAGADAASFLEGQLSQSVAAMAPGDCRWSFVLHPQGKVVALVRVQRTDADRFALLVDGGAGPAVAERLSRFLLRVRAEVSIRTVDVVSLRGPASVLPPRVAEPSGESEPPTGSDAAVPSLWEGWPGYDLLDRTVLPEGAASCDAPAWEAARIGVGLPVNGTELTGKTIPAESGMVAQAADFTKGCYVGQELVARIDSRGRVNQTLRRLTVPDGPVPAAGTVLFADDPVKPVGAITSSSLSGLSGAGVALGYVRREVTGSAVLTTGQGGVEVHLVA